MYICQTNRIYALMCHKILALTKIYMKKTEKHRKLLLFITGVLFFTSIQASDDLIDWQSYPAFPGVAREQAVAVAQNDGFDKCIYVFGGFASDANDNSRLLSDGFVYNLRLKKWDTLDGCFPYAGCDVSAAGANHIRISGGYTEEEGEIVANQKVVYYHTITATMIDEGEIQPVKQGLGVINSLVIFFYFAVLAGIGFYFSKKQKDTDAYFKGGGRIPWWVVGLSIFGTGLSAITFMSIPAKAYATDWSYILMNTGIVLVVPIIIMIFIPFYRRLNVTTAYEYLEQRFNASIRVICSLAFILFQIGRMGIVMFLPAVALNVVTGLDIFLCISLMGVLSLVYTMVGGIEAVVWTDALQVVVLLGGALLVVFYIIADLPGGFNTILTEAVADNKFDLGSLKFDLKQSTIWTVLIATVFTNLTTYGTDQTMVQRYMTTETQKQANKSVLTNALLVVPATLIFFFVGTALYVYYKHMPAELSTTITDGDAILPWYIFTKLPNGVVGLLISGIFAAAMSTLSSSMNSAATAYITDIHEKIIVGKGSLKAARLSTLIFGAFGIFFALLMATWEISSLWDQFNMILGLVLGSMGGLFMLGMLTKRANAAGALCGIIGSVGVQLFIVYHQTVHLLLYTTTGFISCFVIGYICSLILQSPKQVNTK